MQIAKTQTLMLEKIEGRRRRGRQRTRWHHPFNRHKFEQTQGDGEGQGSLTCYSPWGRKESDRTEQLSNNLWDLLGGGDEIIHIKSLAQCWAETKGSESGNCYYYSSISII